MAGDSGMNLVQDGLMAVTDAAKFVGLSRSELYARMQRGELAYCLLGRRRLIPRRALMNLAHQNLVVASGQPVR
jgi:excisionase family DNA binding protein